MRGLIRCHRDQVRKLLAEGMRSARVQRQPLSVVLLRLDDYHRLADEGEPAFELAARRVELVLRLRLRSGDLTCRFAEDTYLLVLPRTDALAGLRVAERIAADVPRLVLCGTHQVTCSAGVAGLQAGPDPDAVIIAADRALARARRDGVGTCVAA